MTAFRLSAQTTIWHNDKAHTRVGFEVGHAGLSYVQGSFSDFSIAVLLENESISSAEIKVEIKTGSINTGVAARDKHLSSADFFNVEKYPAMTFESTKVVKRGAKVKIYGNLALNGITRPVTLNALMIGRKQSPVSGKDTVGFRLTGKILCSDFSFGPKYIPAMIADEVGIIVDAEFYLE